MVKTSESVGGSDEMNKYERLIADLDKTGTGKMKAFGNSMLPILKSGSLLTFEVSDTGLYHVGDIVFCKVRGRYIDAHKIIKVRPLPRGSIGIEYLIANNKGHENGWTTQVYGRVVEAA